MTNILQFKPRTKEYHDTMRQVSNSETPSDLSLNAALKHIARAHQPKSIKWDHLCPCAGMVNTVLEAGQICPDCFVDQDGVHHGDGGETK